MTPVQPAIARPGLPDSGPAQDWQRCRASVADCAPAEAPPATQIPIAARANRLIG